MKFMAIIFFSILSSLAIASEMQDSCDNGRAKDCREHARVIEQSGNMNEAGDYFKRGCDLGDNYSCGELGRLFIDELSKREALTLFTRGCDGDHPESCYYLAILYDNSYRTTGGGDELYRRSCYLGYQIACDRITARSSGK